MTGKIVFAPGPLSVVWPRLPLAIMTILPLWLWKASTLPSMRPAVVGPNEPDGLPFGVLAGPA